MNISYTLPSSSPNKSDIIKNNVCSEILTAKFHDSEIKYFDLVLLIPSLAFFIFLIFHCRNMCKNVNSNNNSIINTFYILLCVACGLKVIRAAVMMALNATDDNTLIVDKCLWLIVRFFLLSTEMAIITFGVAAAKLETRQGIRRVLIFTSLISLTYTATQATLEFTLPDRRFQINNYALYGHGGALFFFISSLILFLVYCSVVILPFSQCSRRLRLPTKRMFYIYCGILAFLYLVEAVGSLLFYKGVSAGLCAIDFTTLIYYIFYDPLVYVTFLHNYLRNRKVIAFKYTENMLENPETSEECYKTYSNVINSSSPNNFNYSIASNQYDKSDELINDIDYHEVDNRTHFYPDNLVTLERNVDVVNINQIMKDYNIMSEGAQLEYKSRYPSSVAGGEIGSLDDKEKSIILSLSEELDSTRRETWDLSDFASQDRR